MLNAYRQDLRISRFFAKLPEYHSGQLLLFGDNFTETHFINRELSWIDFNTRVFQEALRETNTIFERLNFLSIVSTNLNEFFQVRVAALNHIVAKDSLAIDTSRQTFREIINQIYKKNGTLLEKLYSQIAISIHLLENEGIFYKSSCPNFSSKEAQDFLSKLKPENDFSALENQKIYAGFCFENETKFIQIPKYRIFWLDSHTFTTMDDLILANPQYFFGDKKPLFSFTISVDRDSDLVVQDTEDQHDFINAMEETLSLRRFSAATRILIHAEQKNEAQIKMRLGSEFGQILFFVPGFVHPEFLIGLKKGFRKYNFAANDEKESDNFPDMMVRLRSLTKNHRPCCHEIVTSSIFDYLDKKDLLVHFPYESYFPILKFISDAAENRDVTEIKITLYRTEHNSRIVNELVLASLKGKKVTVFMEVKARFNEQLNINLGKILEDAGIKVIYSLEKLKVHAKIALVVKGSSLYANLSTGNYNSETSYVYSDISLFTSKSEITSRVARIFDAIENKPKTLSDVKSSFTDFSDKEQFVFTSPFFIKRKIISLIKNEATHGGDGLIIAKMNNLGDEDIIMELEKAARKGVKILLNVRGICQIYARENIRIISIVGKFLEHSRIFYFKNSGDEKLYVSSSDWMLRNLDKRLEVMFQILDKECFERIKNILMTYFKDESHAHQMKFDGTWDAPKNPKGFSAQNFLLKSSVTQESL